MFGGSLFCLLVAFGYADEARPRAGPWFCNWQPSFFIGLSVCCAVVSVAGETYNAPYAIQLRVREGDRMRCEMTSPLVVLQRKLHSCSRLHTRCAATNALGAARTAAPRQVLQ